MKLFNLTTAASLTLLLIACGSSGDSEETKDKGAGYGDSGGNNPVEQINSPAEIEGPDPAEPGVDTIQVSITGEVTILHPVANAEVCIDINLDGECDSEIVSTDFDGRYTITFESPYSSPEYMVRARIWNNENIEHPRDALNFIDDGEFYNLVSRGYNEGAVNLYTTLEALQYDAALSYVEQADVYAWARRTIARFYDLPWDASFSNLASYIDIVSHNPLFSAYEAALDVTKSSPEALELAYREASKVYALDDYNEMLDFTVDLTSLKNSSEWRGFSHVETSITSNQAMIIEESLLSGGARATLEIDNSERTLRLINEYSRDIIEAVYNGGDILLLDRDFYYYEPLVKQRLYQSQWHCWSSEQRKWHEFSGYFEEYEVTQIHEAKYELINPITNKPVYLHIQAINAGDYGFDAVTDLWAESVNFDEFQFDGSLIRARYEFTDELCYSTRAIDRDEKKSVAFSQMTAKDIGLVVFPEGDAQVDKDLQKVTQDSTGRIIDYRIAEIGEREIIYLFPSSGAPVHSQSTARVWEGGSHFNVNFKTSFRQRVSLDSTYEILLDDITAVNAKTHLENRLSN